MISVIIPAHNAEQTIERAILSAVSQIPDSEIIVVLNGCTDQTEIVAEQLAKEHASVRVLHSEKGVSRARNAGIRASEGEWMMFLDADDWFEEQTGAVIRKYLADPSADLWLFGHKTDNEERSVTDGPEMTGFSGDEIETIRVRMLENPTRYMQVWAKIFRTSLMKEQGLFFHEDLALSEDSDFTFRYSRYCSKICLCPESIYHYALDNASTMRTYDGTKVQKYADAMKETGEAAREETAAIQHAFRKYVLMHMNIAMVREVFACDRTDISRREQMIQMKQTAAQPVFREAIEKTKASECFSLRMAPVLFLKMHLYGLTGLMYRVRAKQNAKKEGRA